MSRMLRIGTRDSQLAVWQATLVQNLLVQHGVASELVYIKSEGDMDLQTPLYEMGVQGIFTRSLDQVLLNERIDIAVHSMKDVPTQLPEGISQAAVLKRGPANDLLVFKGQWPADDRSSNHIATSSIRRMAQWLNKYPDDTIHNLRGNVNTRLLKLKEQNWDAAIFAQAGLERIGLRPANSLVLDWMLPAPAQGAIVVVCRKEDHFSMDSCKQLNDEPTAMCTRVERDFLRGLLGGCSMPISALAEIKNGEIYFRGNILTPDGREKIEIEKKEIISRTPFMGLAAATDLLKNGGRRILDLLKTDVS